MVNCVFNLNLPISVPKSFATTIGALIYFFHRLQVERITFIIVCMDTII